VPFFSPRFEGRHLFGPRLQIIPALRFPSLADFAAILAVPFFVSPPPPYRPAEPPFTWLIRSYPLHIAALPSSPPEPIVKLTSWHPSPGSSSFPPPLRPLGKILLMPFVARCFFFFFFFFRTPPPTLPSSFRTRGGIEFLVLEKLAGPSLTGSGHQTPSPLPFSLTHPLVPYGNFNSPCLLCLGIPYLDPTKGFSSFFSFLSFPKTPWRFPLLFVEGLRLIENGHLCFFVIGPRRLALPFFSSPPRFQAVDLFSLARLFGGFFNSSGFRFFSSPLPPF